MECLIISLPNSCLIIVPLGQQNIQSVLSQTMECAPSFLSPAMNHSIIQVNSVEKFPFGAKLRRDTVLGPVCLVGIRLVYGYSPEPLG
jgi:hypothetical protein